MDPYFLSDSYLLKGAPIGDIDAVRSIGELHTFEPGEPILAEADKGQDIMIVTDGRVRVETKAGDLIDELRAGAMIGEVSFLDGQGRGANVFAVGPTKVFVIPAARLRDLMRENQKLELILLRNASKALCQRLRESNLQIQALLKPG